MLYLNESQSTNPHRMVNMQITAFYGMRFLYLAKQTDNLAAIFPTLAGKITHQTEEKDKT